MGVPKNHPWLKLALAPLLFISIILHGLLLVLPLPSRPDQSLDAEAEAQSETSEEAVVDLLSISSLATETPELPAEPPPAEAPPPEPVPQAVAPQVPTQPVVPEVYPRELPPQEPPPEEKAPEPVAQDEFAQMEPEAPSQGFDPNRQAQLVNNVSGSLGREPGKSNFDLTDQFPGDIWDLYVSQWDSTRQQCFFSSIERSNYTLPPGAADLRYLSRNIREIERTDIPRTFPGQTITPLGTAYCNEQFFEIADGGTPILWLSLVPVSPGGSTALVIIWQQDPRTG
jgi:outer membrane biosynthesis protein TonB